MRVNLKQLITKALESGLDIHIQDKNMNILVTETMVNVMDSKWKFSLDSDVDDFLNNGILKDTVQCKSVHIYDDVVIIHVN